MREQSFIHQLWLLDSVRTNPDIIHPDFPDGFPLLGVGYRLWRAKHIAALVHDSSVGLRSWIFVAKNDRSSDYIYQKVVHPNNGEGISGPNSRKGEEKLYYQVEAGIMPGIKGACTVFVPENATPDRIALLPLEIKVAKQAN